jgi:hypothetical protein
MAPVASLFLTPAVMAAVLGMFWIVSWFNSPPSAGA